eukprot:CFRG6578T1
MAPKKKGKKRVDDDDWESEVVGTLNKVQIGEDGLPMEENDTADVDIDDIPAPASNKKKNKKNKKKEVLNTFAMLNAGMDEDEGSDVEEKEIAPEPSNEEELHAKPPPMAQNATFDSDDDDYVQPVQKKKNKKDKKKKAQKEDEDLDALLAALTGGEAGNDVPDATLTTPTAGDVSEDEDGKDGGGVKTKAQKKAEKKARQKAEAAAKKKSMEEKGETIEESTLTAAVPEPAAVTTSTKGKKGKKGPSAAVRAMQEAQALLRAEEERIKQEQLAAEEMENERIRLIEEEERMAKEKKELKKQKEAEKKERLRKEGKLLTKAQKEANARNAAYLETLKEQGMLPVDTGAESERKKKVVYSNKKRKTPAQIAAEKESAKKEAERLSREEEEKTKALAEKEKDAVKDSWDASGSSSSEEDSDAENEDDGDAKDAWDASSEDEDDETASKSEKKAPTAQKVVKEKSTSPAEESDSNSESDSDYSDSDSDSDEEYGQKKKTVDMKVISKAIEERNALARKNAQPDSLRSPIICVLGHVDTGKTKILDHIRKSNVQTGEAGGITQQIGATFVPIETVRERTALLNTKGNLALNVPGLLIIDTPGHESFSNLRSRGSSLCDLAILVVDLMHGLEPQTIESIQLLKKGKTPFVVALNKIDRLYGWDSTPNLNFTAAMKKQNENVKIEFRDRTNNILAQLAEQGLNACLYHENKDIRRTVSVVPTSAHTGEGLPDLMMLIVQLTQKMMADRLAFVDILQCTVLEVKVLLGLGTTVDVILSQGRLREGDTIVVSGLDGAITTQVRACLMPEPLREMRVKNQYRTFKEIRAAQGIKIAAKHLENAVAGTQLYVAKNSDEVAYYEKLVKRDLEAALAGLQTEDRGVYAQASTLGALEALLVFLKDSKIPVACVNIGPVHRKDVMRASTQLQHDPTYAVILAFDVKVDKDAQDMAKEMGVTLFTADIIYHLFDNFTAHIKAIKDRKKEENRHLAWFPCHFVIKPEFVINKRDPIIVGVDVLEGRLTVGVPVCVPSKDNIIIGTVQSIEINNKEIAEAKVGQSAAVKIANFGSDAPKMYGRQFDHLDELYTRLNRNTIDILKEHFRDDMSKEDWRLIMKMKKMYQIL